MKRIAVAAALLVVACSSPDEAPDVDWSAVPGNQRNLIEQAVESGDCGAMQAYFDGSDDADVLEYLDWQMKHAGCY